MRHIPLLAMVALAAAPLPTILAEAPATRPATHDPANPPIDCPLHEKGISPDTLRPIADTEKYIAFLEQPSRALWQKPDDVVSALHLTGSETLADVGAGSGYFTFRFARALPKGKVIATDIDPEMVRHVHHKVMSEGISNVRAVLADATDPTVDATADVVFICDVLHHVQGREAWLKRLDSEMRPGARLVVIEFKEGKLPEGPPETAKIPRAKLTAMLRDAGFVLESEDSKLLPYQTLFVLEKPTPTTGPTAQ